MKPKITFLGPVGATFSHDAYVALAEIFGAPQVADSESESNCIPASSNAEIIKTVIAHGGYGAIAMETRAQGRVTEPLESFIELLQSYGKNENCPLQVAGAVRLKLHFCLMVQKGMSKSSVSRIIAHPKALGACKNRIAENAMPTLEVSSNGEAARLVAEDERYADCAALGPKSAALKYGLDILDNAFEDSEAITAFFLLTPRSTAVADGRKKGEVERALIVFSISHDSGSLVNALLPFKEEKLNLVQIHSVHVKEYIYHFAIEVEMKDIEREAFDRALAAFAKQTKQHLLFGPFKVV